MERLTKYFAGEYGLASELSARGRGCILGFKLGCFNLGCNWDFVVKGSIWSERVINGNNDKGRAEGRVDILYALFA